MIEANRPAGSDGAGEGVDAVTEDALLGGRVRLRQPARGYRAAIDPVLLAAALRPAAGDKLLDLGCGVGAASLCLLARVAETAVQGLEMRADLARLAQDNAELNRVAGRFTAVVGDVLAPPAALVPGSFDQVLCNPPHLAEAGGSRSPRPLWDGASREGAARLEDWVACALAMLRDKGSVTWLHRADRLDALLAALYGRAGEIVVFPLWPGPPEAGKPAKRVIVRARKGVASPTRLAPGLVLHRSDGTFTAAAEAVLRDGAPLPL